MCAVQYKNINLELAGSPVPDVTGTYTWQGLTTFAGEDYDYWQHAGHGFTIWYLGTSERYVLADTYPAAPGGGDAWWWADKLEAVSVYYAQGTAAAQAHTYPLEPAMTPWHQWGHFKDWLVRSDDTKKMHGQAFYPRSTFSPRYVNLSFYPDPDPEVNPPPIDDAKCCYDPAHDFGTFYLHFTAAFTDDPYSGFSIFQINPRSAGKSWERKHTRLVGQYDDFDAVMPGWADYPFNLTWSCPSLDHLRVFARVWNRLGFLNFGPLTSVPY